MRKFECSQINRIFQEYGLGCGSTTQMEQEVRQSALGMLTGSFFLGIIGKVGKGYVKALCHVSLIIRTYQ